MEVIFALAAAIFMAIDEGSPGWTLIFLAALIGFMMLVFPNLT